MNKPQKTNSTASIRVTKIKDTVANNASRSEKVSWQRKHDNMQKLIAKLSPIETQILDLMAQKMPIIDEITALRTEMVHQCIHPADQLEYINDSTVKCKFCEKTLTCPSN